MTDVPDLISVVIPCYNQSRFLGEAIESVLAQTCRHHEIVVVDDGSTDETGAVAGRYAGVRYVRQQNQGTAAARNRGVREAGGNCLVFLDADDRLLPHAFDTALAAMRAHPSCVLVYGRCRLIARDGSPLPGAQLPAPDADQYLALLRNCHIWHPASVMCRRSAFDVARGFDTALAVCSDYDWYLRVARTSPIWGHNGVVSEYRQHGTNKSIDTARMKRHLVSILRSQRALVAGNTRYEAACGEGIRRIRRHYLKQSLKRAWARLLG